MIAAIAAVIGGAFGWLLGILSTSTAQAVLYILGFAIVDGLAILLAIRSEPLLVKAMA